MSDTTFSDFCPKPQMQPCAGRNCGSTNPNLHSAECFEDYEKATGMAQQEPVAWEQFHEHMAGPFYKTPPQRTWVGLTFAEICECESEYANVFARNIEAKLKELNT